MHSTARPASPARVRGWAAPAAISACALLGGVQAKDRSLFVVAGAVALTVLAALLVPGRRATLLPVFAVPIAAGVIVFASGDASDVGWFAVCLIAGWSAFVCGIRAVAALWSATVVLFGVEWLLTTDDRGWFAWVAGVTLTTACCLFARRQWDLAEALRIAQAGLADRARAEERNRIARELHDVLAHSLTVSLLHVSSARLAVEEDPAEAVGALREAERLGRECLDEVRQVVGLLRSDESAGTAPLPGAAQIGPLVERFRGAGADVTLDVDGDPAGLTASAGLAVHRILQEALTNAARHAPGAPTRANLSVGASGAVLVVDTAGTFDDASGAPGGGLLSMRERAEMLGGTCVAGPAAGGWRVRAELPRQAVRP